MEINGQKQPIYQMEEPKYEHTYVISGIFSAANLNFWVNVAKLVGLSLSCALAVTLNEVAFVTPSSARPDELALLQAFSSFHHIHKESYSSLVLIKQNL